MNQDLQQQLERLQRANARLSADNAELGRKLKSARRKKKDLERQMAIRTGELATSEDWFRALAENVPSMFSYVDRRQIYRYVNRQYETTMNRPMEAIIGRSVREIIAPENYRAVAPHIEKALAGAPQRFIGDFSFPAGARVMDIRYVPDRDSAGAVQGFFALVHDITEIDALERALDATKQRLEGIFRTAADGLLTATPDGRVEDFNQAATELFGLSAKQARQRPIGELLAHPDPDDAEWLRQAWRAAGAARDALPTVETLGGDGAGTPLELSIRWIADLGLYVLVLRDISERRRLEQEVIDLSTQEQERLGREIHDGLGQQLTALSLMAAGLAKRLQRRDVPEAKDALELRRHLEQTLADARILSSGLSPVEITPEGLPGALQALTDRVCAATGIDCRFEHTGDLPLEEPEQAAHLYRIAQEALNNAVKHSGAQRILIRLHGDARRLTLSVQDDGRGLSSADHRSPGLGLHIMHYRAHILGGRLAVESAAGGGMLVRFSFTV